MLPKDAPHLDCDGPQGLRARCRQAREVLRIWRHWQLVWRQALVQVCARGDLQAQVPDMMSHGTE